MLKWTLRIGGGLVALALLQVWRRKSRTAGLMPRKRRTVRHSLNGVILGQAAQRRDPRTFPSLRACSTEERSSGLASLARG